MNASTKQPRATNAPTTVSRRRLFAWTGSAVAIGAVGAGGAAAVLSPAGAASPAPVADSPTLPGPVPFHGIHQAGIATPTQGHLLLNAYDVPGTVTRAQLTATLKAWTTTARSLTAGKLVEQDPTISVDGDPAALTVTVGIGGALLDRLGIARPGPLAELPAFAGDELEERFSGGDLVVQLCADDPLVLAGADRALRKAAGATVRPRWQQAGFQGAAARRDGRTTRNLMGQVDGTNNVSTSERARSGPVWVDATDPGWLTGGSYLVVRRIRMLLDDWEKTPLDHQEKVIGRHKHSGAPLGSKLETDPVDLDARRPDGSPVIPADSHVRLSHPNPGEEMHRRGFSYRAGILPDGTSDEGLLFLAYVKDPTTSFVPVQHRLAQHDALNAFTRTTGSALFAMLPGITGPDDWYGRALLS